jgi:predicted Zn-dependent protease
MKFSYTKDPVAAEKLALRAAELAPDDSGPYLLLAEIMLARPTPENLQRAGGYAYQAGARDLSNPRPPYHLGRVSLQKNDLPRAIQALEHSIQLGATPETVAQLAIALRRAGKVADANRWAALHQEYTDRNERRNALLVEIALEHRQPANYYAIARLYLDGGQPQDAVPWVQEGLRLKPNDPEGDRLLARVRDLEKQPPSPPLLPLP